MEYSSFYCVRYNEHAKMNNLEHDKTLKRLGKKLETLRLSQNLSISDFAQTCQVTESEIIRLEKGELDCEIHLLLRVSDALQVNLAELFSS